MEKQESLPAMDVTRSCLETRRMNRRENFLMSYSKDVQISGD
jgi:hypothetical protein